MAHRAKSFRLDEKKKAIIIYSNVEAGVEQNSIDFYMREGYKPMYEVKKPSKTISDMRKEMEDAPEVLSSFNAAYKDKNGGFHKACKIYADFVKSNRKSKKK